MQNSGNNNKINEIMKALYYISLCFGSVMGKVLHEEKDEWWILAVQFWLKTTHSKILLTLELYIFLTCKILIYFNT